MATITIYVKLHFLQAHQSNANLQTTTRNIQLVVFVSFNKQGMTIVWQIANSITYHAKNAHSLTYAINGLIVLVQEAHLGD